jgi:hypothetical protein
MEEPVLGVRKGDLHFITNDTFNKASVDVADSFRYTLNWVAALRE